MTEQEQIDLYLKKNPTPLFKKQAMGKGSKSNKQSHKYVKKEKSIK